MDSKYNYKTRRERNNPEKSSRQSIDHERVYRQNKTCHLSSQNQTKRSNQQQLNTKKPTKPAYSIRNPFSTTTNQSTHTHTRSTKPTTSDHTFQQTEHSTTPTINRQATQSD